jgi:aminocarboxymuconate-semialdehyde decarboxylase
MSTEQRPIADLHCHIFPAEAARHAGTSILIEPVDGGYRFGGPGGTDLDAGLLDLALQIEDMDRQGVHVRALAIPPFTLRYDLPPDDGVRWARAINDGIAAAVASHPDRFVGFATLPLQHVAAAVEELDRAVTELGLVGVEIATHIVGVELDDPRFDPFWAATETRRLPILVHPHDPAGGNRMGDYYLRNLVGNPVETALAGARLIFGGILERYPDLRVILSHGGGALPQLVGRLRHGYAARPEAKLRVSDPVASLRRLHYDTIVFNPEPLRNLVATVGASQVVLGTDYPFDMGEPDPVGFTRNAGLAPDEIETILGNGARLLADARAV